MGFVDVFIVLCASQSRSIALQLGSVCGVWENILAGRLLAVCTSDGGVHLHLEILRCFFPQDRGLQPGHSVLLGAAGHIQILTLPQDHWKHLPFMFIPGPFRSLLSTPCFSSELRFPHSGLSNKCSSFYILSGCLKSFVPCSSVQWSCFPQQEQLKR